MLFKIEQTIQKSDEKIKKIWVETRACDEVFYTKPIQ